MKWKKAYQKPRPVKFRTYLLWVQYANDQFGPLLGSWDGSKWNNLDNEPIDLNIIFYRKVPKKPKEWRSK